MVTPERQGGTAISPDGREGDAPARGAGRRVFGRPAFPATTGRLPAGIGASVPGDAKACGRANAGPLLLLLLLAACAGPPRWECTRRWPDPPIQAPATDLRVETRARREALARELGGPGTILLFAAPADDEHRFFQDDDFWYLSGVAIPDVALALVVDGQGRLLDEVLWLPPHSDRFERWNGPRLAPGPEAETATGFARTAPVPEDPAGWTGAVAALGAGPVYSLAPLPFPAPDGITVVDGAADGPSPLRTALARLRLVKSPYELACLRNAIDITGAGLLDALTEIAPGRPEYAPQSALEAAFVRLGSERPGFPSICGSGANAVTLHYDKNRASMAAGDLLVMDVGAKYRYYCADVTRTVPVNGRFTPRQRQIYSIVLAAQTAAARAARPGMTIRDLDGVARRVITEAGYGDAFLHSIGHWIGLDVHDQSGVLPDATLEAGTTFTIEPGIYLADEALGVRIEDDYLMTPDGAVKLSDTVPSDPDAIEALMATLR